MVNIPIGQHSKLTTAQKPKIDEEKNQMNKVSYASAWFYNVCRGMLKT